MEIPQDDIAVADLSRTETVPDTPCYTPASESQRMQALDKAVKAVRRLQYLQMTGSTAEGGSKEMVQVRLEPKRGRFDAEAIKADMRNVWQLDVAGTGQGIYRIADTPDGFDFRFALLEEGGEFVTGLIAVNLADRTDKARWL